MGIDQRDWLKASLINEFEHADLGEKFLLKFRILLRIYNGLWVHLADKKVMVWEELENNTQIFYIFHQNISQGTEQHIVALNRG